MKEFNFKNYPARILIPVILSVSIIITIFNLIVTGSPLNGLKILLTVLGSSSIVTLVFIQINKNLMNSWYLSLLGLTDLRGRYTGELLSSFHVNDNPAREKIRMLVELQIAQNINGIKISGQIKPSVITEGPTSHFASEWSILQQLENGEFLLEYRYNSTVNISHSWHQKYRLTSHTGFTSLTFNPDKKTLKGFYFSYENQSHGNISLSQKQQIL